MNLEQQKKVNREKFECTDFSGDIGGLVIALKDSEAIEDLDALTTDTWNKAVESVREWAEDYIEEKQREYPETVGYEERETIENTLGELLTHLKTPDNK